MRKNILLVFVGILAGLVEGVYVFPLLNQAEPKINLMVAMFAVPLLCAIAGQLVNGLWPDRHQEDIAFSISVLISSYLVSTVLSAHASIGLPAGLVSIVVMTGLQLAVIGVLYTIGGRLLDWADRIGKKRGRSYSSRFFAFATVAEVLMFLVFDQGTHTFGAEALSSVLVGFLLIYALFPFLLAVAFRRKEMIWASASACLVMFVLSHMTGQYAIRLSPNRYALFIIVTTLFLALFAALSGFCSLLGVRLGKKLQSNT